MKIKLVFAPLVIGTEKKREGARSADALCVL